MFIMSEVPLFGSCMLDMSIWHPAPGVSLASREREMFIDNLLVRVHLIIEMSRPALRHGSLNPLFQVALYLRTRHLLEEEQVSDFPRLVQVESCDATLPVHARAPEAACSVLLLAPVAIPFRTKCCLVLFARTPSTVPDPRIQRHKPEFQPHTYRSRRSGGRRSNYLAAQRAKEVTQGLARRAQLSGASK